MMARIVSLTFAIVAGATLLAQTPNLANDLQRAKAREVASGDCKSVLPEYTRIAEQGAKTDRASAAEALLRVGMCQERNRDPRAKDSYSRITEQFASEKIFAEDAKRRLIALRASVNSITPAATFLIRQPSGGSA